MTSEREGFGKNINFNPRFDRTPEKTYNFFLKEEQSKRSNTIGLNQRNKSYDILLSNKNHSKKALKVNNGSEIFERPMFISMWGNISGLGLNDDFEKIGELDEELSDVSFSDGHVVVLTEGNKVLVRGKNDSKQLGFDSKEILTSFKMLSLPQEVKFVRVECGGDFTYALGSEGQIYSWGLNIKGQLGHGHFQKVSSAGLLKYLLPPEHPEHADSKSPRVSRRTKENDDDIKLSMGEKISDVS